VTTRSVNPSEVIPDSLLETAAEWVARIQAPDASEEDFAQWEEWLKSDMAHAAAYAAVEEVWELVPLIDPPWPTRKELAAETIAGSNTAARPGLSSHRSLPFLSAAAAFALVVIGGWFLSGRDARVLETTTAEQRSLALPDGSRVTLAPETRLIIEQRPERRGVKLEHGQAYFEVAHDPSRPFAVRVGDHEAVAVGTAFDINGNADQFTVTVTQGVVQLRSLEARGPIAMEVKSSPDLRLEVGDRAAIDRTGNSHVERIPRLEEITSWRSGRLEYVHQPLKIVVQDVNRYTNRKIEFADPSIGELLFTGTVFVDQLDGWLAALPGAFPLKVVERGSYRLLQHAG
jgi:transmembrane sensor